MTELEVAQQIRDGLLPSPTMIGDMAMFAVRVTGTGLSYRSGLDEYVWRSPDIFLSEDFQRRVPGVPLVWEHPKDNKLTSEEFQDKIIGTLCLPYVKGDELWSIARVYDSAAIELMKNEQLSTSPGVVFKPTDGNVIEELPDGQHLLIEGVPSHLCHLAVCDLGVWDKGGPPTGVSTTLTTESVGMTEDEKAAADKARKDADMAAKLDAALSKLDAAHARLDAMDKARKDADEEREEKSRREAEEAKLEKERADKARKDAARKDRFGARKDGESDEDYTGRWDADEKAEREEREEEGDAKEVAADKARKSRKDAADRHDKERADKARKDAEEKERMDATRADAALRQENDTLKARLAAFESKLTELTRETPDEERNALAAAQARADSVAAMFGERASAPTPGEPSLAYRKRLLSKVLRHSPRLKDARLDSADAAAIAVFEDIAYADAAEAARGPDNTSAGILVPVVTRDSAGRQITTFRGDPLAWMAPFMATGNVGHVNRSPNHTN